MSDLSKAILKVIENDLDLEFKKHEIPINQETKRIAFVAAHLTMRVFVEAINRYLQERGVNLAEVGMAKYRIAKIIEGIKE